MRRHPLRPRRPAARSTRRINYLTGEGHSLPHPYALFHSFSMLLSLPTPYRSVPVGFLLSMCCLPTPPVISSTFSVRASVLLYPVVLFVYICLSVFPTPHVGQLTRPVACAWRLVRLGLCIDHVCSVCLSVCLFVVCSSFCPSESFLDSFLAISSVVGLCRRCFSLFFFFRSVLAAPVCRSLRTSPVRPARHPSRPLFLLPRAHLPATRTNPWRAAGRTA